MKKTFPAAFLLLAGFGPISAQVRPLPAPPAAGPAVPVLSNVLGADAAAVPPLGCAPEPPDGFVGAEVYPDARGPRLPRIVRPEDREAAKGTEHPGRFLEGRVFHLLPGQVFAFRAWENQIQGIAAVQAEGARIGSKIIKSRELRSLGGKTLVEHLIAVPENIQPGSEIRVLVSGTYQSRGDADWSFGFTLVVN